MKRLLAGISRGFNRLAGEPSPTTRAIDFLPDADEIERRPLPRLLQRTAHILVFGFILALIMASVMKVDLVVSARGRLITPLPNIVVQAFDTAIIQEISVKPGQVVKKGDKLAVLDRTFTEADEKALRSRLESLDNQKFRLEQELSGKAPLKPLANTNQSEDQQIQNRLAYEKQASYLGQSQRLNETIARLQASLNSSEKDLQALTPRIQILQEMYTLQSQLVAQQFAPRSRMLDAQERLLEAERNAEGIRNRMLEMRKELAAQEAERKSFHANWRQKISEELLTIARERDGLIEQLQKADKRNRLVTLTAPADAVVLEIPKLSVGSIARSTEPFVTLVPLSDVLEADVQIESRDIGYVRLGDPVHLKVDTFPYQLHGFLEGSLKVISQDAFSRDARNTPDGSAYYQGRIQLTRQTLDRMPEASRLLPGMTVTAEIAVGKRTVMSYLIWPLVKALNESIREP